MSDVQYIDLAPNRDFSRGPFEIYKAPNGFTYVKDDDGEKIAQIFFPDVWHKDDTRNRVGEWKLRDANARLLAGSSDLFEALVAVRYILRLMARDAWGRLPDSTKKLITEELIPNILDPALKTAYKTEQDVGA